MDQVSGQHGGATLGEYSGAFRRRWWVVALGAVFGLALASVYLLVVPKTYISTASVFVDSIGGTGDNAVEGARTISGINLDTEAQIVTSQAVSSAAKVLLQTPEVVGQLVQHVSVTVPPNTNVLRISFSASSPAEAQAGASAYARGYLSDRLQRAADIRDQQLKALDRQISEYQTQLQTVGPDEKEGIQATLQTLQSTRAIIAGSDVSPGEVISEPLPPRRPASPNAALVLTSGLAFGILLGLAGLYLLERRDGRCYDWKTVERRLGLAVLADIPGRDGSPAPLFEPHSPGAEAFGELRNSLLTGLGDDPAVLVVASPSSGFGADVVAANLGVTLARSGRSTTIVIADESSEIPVLFGLPATDGLTETLRGGVDLSTALEQVPDLPSLAVLPAGHGLTSEIDDLEGSGVVDVLEGISETTHYVIIRARPSDSGADAQFFGRHANAAIPVVEIGRTVREAVSAGVRQWRLVGTTVPGVVTLPAFDAPEPAPPRAVTTGSTEAGPVPRPALRPTSPASPTSASSPDTPKKPAESPSGSSANGIDRDGSAPGSPAPSAPTPRPTPAPTPGAPKDQPSDNPGDPLRKAPPNGGTGSTGGSPGTPTVR